MSPISIAQVKEFRESLGATHLVLFAVGEDGEQHVATHGETELNARQAATAGNNLKTALGWPEGLCQANPLPRKCKNCTFFKADRGIRCFNGWSGDGSTGWCLWEPNRVKVQAEDKCGHFEPNV